MKAVILAAGEGTRLRPYTRDRPKCLVRLAGIPLLHRQLAVLESCGVGDITLVTGYRAAALAGLGYPTCHNPDYGRTNMVRSLMCADRLLDGAEDVLITYGDIVYEPRILRSLQACPDPIAICVDRKWRRLWELRMDDPLADAETLRLDARGSVLEIGRRPRCYAEIHAQYMGLTKVRADFALELVRLYRELAEESLEASTDLARLDMTSFLQQLVERGYCVRAVPVDAGWLEIDTVRDLVTYEEAERAGTLSALYRTSAAPDRGRCAQGSAAAPSRGRARGAQPRVWVLADYMVGHTHQCVGLAEALGWPFEVKALEFNGLNRLNNQLLGATRLTLTRASAAKLEPPWPDLVICAGRRLTPPARFVARQSGGRTRLVQLGRKGGNRAEPFDLVVSCAHFGLPPHPRRLEVLTPVNRVTDELLARAAAGWSELCPDPMRAPIGVLVGGSCGSHRFEPETAGKMGRSLREFARRAGRPILLVTSRRTSSAAMQALERALSDCCTLFYRWRPDDSANPYWGCLALASVLVVTGESESMLAEAVAAGKPVYIYPIPERRRLRYRIARSIVARGRSAPRRNFCAWLVHRGLVHVPRDLAFLHRGLVEAGAARRFGEPFDTTARPPVHEMSKVVRRVRELMHEL